MARSNFNYGQPTVAVCEHCNKNLPGKYIDGDFYCKRCAELPQIKMAGYDESDNPSNGWAVEVSEGIQSYDSWLG